MKMTRRNFLSASALTLLSCQLAPAARADCLLSDLFHGADTALPPKPLTAKVVDANPFMGRSESNIHHDCYNTDSTDAILPVGICPEVNVAMEKTNPNASPAIFFDNFDNPVSPFLGGLAIRDLEARLRQGKLTFASPERMERWLGLRPGSVSPFGLINDPARHVHLFLDASLQRLPAYSFHPNDNRATVVIPREEFLRYLSAVGNGYELIELY